jgi:GH24 family phage-related lysozyme (muramidase)
MGEHQTHWQWVTDMKRVSIWTIAILLASLAPSGQTQSTSSPVKTPAQAKQDKQAAKARSKADNAAAKQQSGKKTTTSQDAAYALAYQKGIPKT